MRHFLVLLLLIIFANCAYAQSLEKKEAVYAPIEASLLHINQKVASHLLISGIPDDFNDAQYKQVVTEVCYPNPFCRSQAQPIFDSYLLRVHKIDDMFSVMLCNKELGWKVMEAFSCNNLRVPIESWKQEDKVGCDFEENWQSIQEEHCKK